jgi:hypothetical protein
MHVVKIVTQVLHCIRNLLRDHCLRTKRHQTNVGLEAIRQNPVDESIEHLFQHIEAAQVIRTIRLRYRRRTQLHLENKSAVPRAGRKIWSPLMIAVMVAVFVWISVDEIFIGESARAVKRLEILRQRIPWSFKGGARQVVVSIIVDLGPEDKGLLYISC